MTDKTNIHINIKHILGKNQEKINMKNDQLLTRDILEKINPYQKWN